MLPECTRHPEGLALLQKCKENPDDFSSRLELADWLNNQGEEQAGLQIRYSQPCGRFSPVMDLPEHWRPLKTISDGWFGYEAQTVDELVESGMLHSPWLSCAQVTINGDAAEQSARFLEASSDSTLMRLKLSFDHDCRKLATAIKLFGEASQFENVEQLEIDGKINDPAVVRLAKSTSFRKLKSLKIRGARLGGESIRQLAQSPMLATTKEFELRLSSCPPDWMIGLAESHDLRQLEGLTLQGFASEASHAAIASSPIVEKLSRLCLSFANTNRECAIALANSAKLGNLKQLLIDQSPLGDSGCRELCQSANLRQLNTLVIDLCQIGVDGARSIAESVAMQNLETLISKGNPFGDGFRDIILSKNLPNLRHCEVHRGDITDDIILALNQSHANHNSDTSDEPVSSLEFLLLPNNQISATGAESLIRNKRFKHLKSLVLHGNPIAENDRDELTRLAESQGMFLCL